MNSPTSKITTADLNEWLEAIARMQIATSKILSASQPEQKPAEKKSPFVYVAALKPGTYFYRQSTDRREIFMRLRPASFLLNSTLVSEALSAGKSLICNVETGSTFFVLGNEPVIPLDLEG